MLDKKIWIFDLDNTLYSPSTKIFDKIDLRMKTYISKELDISIKESFIIQKNLYKKYGTTLFGLMKLYNFKPKEFLDFVHDIDLSKIKKSKKLKELIERLPGEKVIFTNGDEKWAIKILTALGIEKSINKVFDIIKNDYIPKPQKKSYENFLKRNNINPKNSIFFEDTEKNLQPAHELGITTVHIHEKFKLDKKEILKPFIDYKFNCIKIALENILKKLEKN